MFNALKYSKELEHAGFSREQAETTIGVFFSFMDHEFATKTDLAKMESSLSERIQSEAQFVRSEFQSVRAEIKALEYRMTIKMGLMQVASVSFLATLIKFF